MIRVILSGASGQVGRALVSAIEADADLTVAAAAAPSLGIGLADALSAGQGDVVVDFTAPEFAEPACRLCIDARVPLVLGTTGWLLSGWRSWARRRPRPACSCSTPPTSRSGRC